MKFAICNETFEDWPPEKTAEAIAKCGYTGIEIAPFTLNADARQITASQKKGLIDACRAWGLEIVGLHWLLAKTQGLHLTSPDVPTRERTRDYLIELARLCRELGGQVMVFGSPQQRNLQDGISTEQGLQFAAEVFSALMPACRKNDVVLAVEPLGPQEGNFLNTADETARLVDMVDHPNCRLHLDCKAMTSEREEIPDIIATHANRLEHFHANDPNLLGPGMGELQFESILKSLRDSNYQGWISVEVFDYSPGAVKIAQESIDYLRQCLAKVS
ncbi:MAG: sugar phosphate isomerase/epimerase [Pirellulales bacterium]|nr:sugar phosphate isomerase/epimerase [Pirellulales bacterium]